MIIKNIPNRTNKLWNEVFKNDILFPQSTTVDNRSLISPACMNDEKAQTSWVFAIRPKEWINGNFVAIYSKGNTKQHLKLAKKWQGLTIVHLYYNSIKDETIYIPSLPEQEKIWSLFEQLDSHISKNQQKLEKLKNMKQSFLQKLFPKDWSALPELRFKGFEGAWEERKFWNIVKLRRWLTYNPDNIEKDWIRVLRSSNILEDCFRIEEDDVFVNVNAININYASNWNILITAANWSPRLVWKHTIIKWIKENTTVHWWFMLLWETKNPNFINSSMWSTWYKKFLWLYVSWWNWAIGNLNKNSLENYMFYIPKKEEEQEKIWAFFEKLDTQITQQTQKIQKLQNLKQSLLEKMFI